MVQHKLVSFATVVALWTLVTCRLIIKADLHTAEVERHTKQKLSHFGRYVAKAKLFCLKRFVPVTRAGVFILENIHPGYRDRKNRDLSNWGIGRLLI